MNILPLVMREMNVALRRKSTRRLWLCFGAGAMAFVVWVFMSWTGNPIAAGRVIFQFLAYAVVLASLILSVFLASDVISRERRENTLGFLFLTDLRAVDVVLGKLASMGLVPGYTLLATLPGFAICQLTGGITLGEFWRMMAALVLCVLYGLSVSIAVSCWCLQQRKAQSVTAVLLLFGNPALLCFLFSRPHQFWLAFAWFGAVAAVLLTWSCGFLSVTWRRQEDPAPAKAKACRARRKGLEKMQPITWLMLPRLENGRFRGFLAGVVLVGCFWLRESPEALLAVLAALQIGLQAGVMVQSSYAFYQDRQDGSLELLLGTKLTTEEVFEGLYHALLRTARPLLWMFTTITLLISLWLLLAGHYPGALFALGLNATLWVGFLSYSWVGVFSSLVAGHPVWAITQTVARVLVPPLLVVIWALATSRPGAGTVITVWIFATVALGLFFASEARKALFKHGRELLLRPQWEKVPIIESEWSFMNWDEEAPPRPVVQST